MLLYMQLHSFPLEAPLCCVLFDSMVEVEEKMLHGFSPLSSSMNRCVDDREDRIEDDDCLFDSTTVSDEYTASGASSSMEFMDDASTTSSSSPSLLVSSGPLYDLSSLMTNLPIKRGLSNYFQGKSKSFASLAEVFSVEDLAKRDVPMIKRRKTCKGCASCPDGIRSSTLGACKKTITKKPTRGSGLSAAAKRHTRCSRARSPTG